MREGHGEGKLLTSWCLEAENQQKAQKERKGLNKNLLSRSAPVIRVDKAGHTETENQLWIHQQVDRFPKAPPLNT